MFGFVDQARPFPGFLTALLQIMTQTGIDEGVALAAAIQFKNSVCQGWIQREGYDRIWTEEQKGPVRDILIEVGVTILVAIPLTICRSLAVVAAGCHAHKVYSCHYRAWPAHRCDCQGRFSRKSAFLCARLCGGRRVNCFPTASLTGPLAKSHPLFAKQFDLW